MKNSKNLRKWLDDMNLSHPLLIAGPCSAETENQVLDIAHQLKDSDTIVYRAGIWKPRTRPGNFEGVGSLALQWMKKVKKETGILSTLASNSFEPWPKIFSSTSSPPILSLIHI